MFETNSFFNYKDKISLKISKFKIRSHQIHRISGKFLMKVRKKCTVRTKNFDKMTLLNISFFNQMPLLEYLRNSKLESKTSPKLSFLCFP